MAEVRAALMPPFQDRLGLLSTLQDPAVSCLLLLAVICVIVTDHHLRCCLVV